MAFSVPGKAAVGKPAMGKGMGKGMGYRPVPAPMPVPVSPCTTKMGPVANVCNSAKAVTQMIPVTSVTPIINPVPPQVMYGAPVTVGVSNVPGWGAGFGKAVPYGPAPGYGKPFAGSAVLPGDGAVSW